MEQDKTQRARQENPSRILLPGAVAWESYVIWATNLGLWLRLSLFPVLVLIGGAALIWIFVPLEAQTASNSSSMSYKISLGFTFAALLAELPLVTAWHRLILLRDDEEPHRYVFGRREWRYLLTALMVGIGMGLLAAILHIGSLLLFANVAFTVRSEWVGTFLAFMFDVGLWAIVICCFAGLLFRLPAAAVGPQNARPASSLSVKGNRWRLVRSYLAALWPLAIIALLIEEGLRDIDGVPGFTLEIVHRLVFLIFAPIVVGVLSITYRELAQKPEAAGDASS